MDFTDVDDFLHALTEAGWTVSRKTEASLSLNPTLCLRYPNLPDDYLQFLQAFTLCTNAADTAWFLSQEDFNADDLSRRNAGAFRWNEYEQMSLDAAVGEREEIKRIEVFWDNYFPIALAVHSDYAYLAVCTASEQFGSIVYGYGPEFEDVAQKINDSFTEFIQRFSNFLGNSDKTGVPREFRDLC